MDCIDLKQMKFNERNFTVSYHDITGVMDEYKDQTNIRKVFVFLYCNVFIFSSNYRIA